LGSTLAQWALVVFFASLAVAALFVAILIYRLIFPPREDE
jgi:predicted permease